MDVLLQAVIVFGAVMLGVRYKGLRPYPSCTPQAASTTWSVLPKKSFVLIRTVL